ncbi:CG30046 [Drosophila busckii]|uniref:Spondin-1 n=1 Tax=Drosophila busckii TaxID=30019 RepID=A0A0M4EVX2_DROBS|nr:CG30046 [Drosophila busckii]
MLVLLLLWAPYVRTLICTRRPANTQTPKSPVDENYVISITGNPETYILGQEYNVSLNAFNGHRYISFILALENEYGDFNYMNDLGRFELSDLIETRFSPNCVNMVENTNTNPKTHMHLTWIAPSERGSGCILIRATVLQHRDVWHMDDGGLTRRICEEVVDDVESQPSSHTADAPCCACDEAGYELTFEGVWSRNLHPRNFPARSWETRFCELLGASHSSDYRFWESGALASAGVKQYAEHCSSNLLEREFSINFREQKIRTIIKARGPAFPNLNGKAMATVRVDPLHHMVSFASKIEPSPDWIVGISGLELCMRNCTWLETKLIKLYPWDMGTDAGPTYTSPDQPQVPPDVIRRMRSDFPNDPRSPFYDESGAPMKPMATLTIRRRRLYERRCADEESNNEPDVPRDCLTHPWSSWSDCSAKCGDGVQIRRRVYKQPELARLRNCNVPLYDERACQGQVCGGIDPMLNAREDEFAEFGAARQQNTYERRAECQLSAWSDWSSCSVTCGEGYQARQRQYLSPGVELKCQSVHRLELQEMRKCSGRSCLGNLPTDESIGGDLDAPDEQNRQEPFAGDNYNSFNREFEREPTDENFAGTGFSVGDLKGNQPQWNNVPEMPIRKLGQTMSRQPQMYDEGNNRAAYYGNYPRLEDDERTSWQRKQTSDNSEAEDPQQRWGNNAVAEPRQRWGNNALEEPRQPEEERPTASRQSFGNAPYAANIETAEVDAYLSIRCFQMLGTSLPRCHDRTIVGNFWFYNYCADECMLFAADPCDRNVNKFSSLEACEQCRRPEFQQLQEKHSKSQACEMFLASWQAQEKHLEQERQQKRRPSSRRRNYQNRN